MNVRNYGIALAALLGGAAGLVFAWWSTDALIALGPADLPRLEEIRVNGTVVAFTLGIATLTSLDLLEQRLLFTLQGLLFICQTLALIEQTMVFAFQPAFFPLESFTLLT